MAHEGHCAMICCCLAMGECLFVFLGTDAGMCMCRMDKLINMEELFSNGHMHLPSARLTCKAASADVGS